MVLHPIEHVGLYDFLDELAGQRVIEINSAIKPYSRKLIATKLKEADSKREQLNKRQKADLHFYLKDFNKEVGEESDTLRRDAFYRSDSTFALTVNPIFGLTGWATGDESLYHRYGGAELHGFFNGLGIHFRLTDNHESITISNPSFLTQRKGALYKSSSTAGADFSRMRGGITYDWNWGSIGLMRENMVWGNANNGAIVFSQRAPTYTRILLNLAPKDWIELNYSHGYLVSGIIDSSRSYPAGARDRKIYVPKFIAANMLTVKPMKGLHLSLGNSVVYSDYVNPAFLIPFMFYKSIDHQSYYGTGNYGGQNAQMYFDVSSRQIKNLHLYATVFVDEISFGRMWDKGSHSNFVSLKSGLRWTNMANSNLSLIGEFTRTNPIVYQHFVNTTTFTSNNFGLGHYLGDNSREIYLALLYRPVARCHLKLGYTRAEKGTYYPYDGVTNVLGLPFLENVDWQYSQFSISGNYELINDIVIHGSIDRSKVEQAVIEGVNYQYTPDNVNRDGWVLSAGFTIGF